MTSKPDRTADAVYAENEALRTRLAEAEQALEAIRSGAVDALVASGEAAGEVYVRQGTNRVYRLLIEDMTDGALTLAADGLILYANRSLADLLDTPLEQVIGSSIHAWIAPEGRGILASLLHRQPGTGKHHKEVELIAGDGTVVPVFLSVNPVYLEGMPESFCAVAVDLREQRRNQRVMAAEQLARSILEQAAEAVVVCDQTGRIMRVSAIARQLCAGDPIGQIFEQAFPLQWLDPAAEGLVDRKHEEAHLDCTGQGFDFLVSTGPLIGPEGAPIGSVISMVDIGERKRAEAAILAAQAELRGLLETATQSRRSLLSVLEDQRRGEEALRTAEEQFRGLVEQAIAGIYIVQQGRLVYLNHRCAEILGFADTADLLGREFLPMVAEIDRETTAESLRRLHAGEVSSLPFEFTTERRDGVMITIGVHGSRATHRGAAAIIGLMQDISEKKRSETQIARYLEQLQGAFLRTVEVITALTEMRDPYTSGHEKRVAEIAVAIGAELGFDAQQQEGLRVAGYLHDVGKIIIPAEILSKPGRLSAAEYELIKGHPRAGFDILKGVEFPWPVAEAALQHHERMDGSGYPQGLKGTEILLEARILAVADVVESMGSHRPYRAMLGIDQALAEIEGGRGRLYDADAADACLRIFREQGFQLDRRD